MREHKRWSTVCLYLLCAPWDGILLVFAALLAPLLGLRAKRARGVLWMILPQRSKLARYWRYSTTLGHLVLLQERAQGTDVEDHELVHVRQFEGAAVSVWLVFACAWGGIFAGGPLAAACTVALLGPWWSYFGASGAAFLRGERGYLDNHFERHARAETSLYASSEKGVKLVSRS